MPSAGDYARASDTTRYYCMGTQSSTQSGIVTGTFTAIQYNAADSVDSLGIHDPVTNNTKFTIGLALGWWLVTGAVSWGTLAAVRYGARVALNGTAVNGSEQYCTGNINATTSTTQTFVQSTVSTDYVEIYGRQDTGGNAVTSVSGAYRSLATLYYLGP